ncbi:MAG: SIMPL domain-containing protein [Candidatus Altiarchaeota archaeon]|nr:SIMPL domain-containing protein [Candidatus Altiarchaeota archaeon]
MEEGNKCCMSHGIVTVLLVGLLMAAFLFAFRSLVADVGRPIVEVNPVIQAASPDSSRNTLSVSGSSQVTVNPDEAYVYISVITNASTAKVAQDDNRKTTNAVIAEPVQQGIAADDIETTTYNLQKRYDWVDKEGKSVETGYVLTHTLKVTTGDVEDVGTIVDAAVGAGANGVEQVEFGLTKVSEKKVRDQALLNATMVARDKAERMAQAAGVKLVKVISVYESNYYYTPYEYNVRSNMGDYATAAPSLITPQKVDVSSSVQVVYEIG